MAKKTKSPQDIMEIALNDLVLSDQNVRKQAACEDELKVLMASIETIGLLHPLMVVPSDRRGDLMGEGKSYQVVAGGRRLAALNALVLEDKLKADHRVYCREVAEGVSIEELSLMENLARTSMSPIDELKSFELLKTKGLVEDDIARHFGITVKAVQRRLRLARVADPILEAYQEGNLTLDTLQAYAVTDDQERQLEYFQNAPSFASTDQIRKSMIRESYNRDHKLVKFIGIEHYEASGGPVTRDLFSENVFLEDVGLVERLAHEKLEQSCAAYLAEGWKWAEATLDFDLVETKGMGRVHQQHVELTDDLAQELELELEQIEASLEAFELMDDDLTDEQQLEYNSARKRREALFEARRGFAAEDKARAGVIIHLSYYGEEQVNFGLVKAEDMTQEPGKEPGKEKSDGGSGVEPSSPNTNAPLYSQALLDSLRNLRCKAMQADIAKNPDMAFDLLLYSMSAPLFSSGWTSAPLDISPRLVGHTLSDEEQEASCGWVDLQEVEDSFGLKWGDDATANFDTLAALLAEEKHRLLAYCVARTLNSQLAPAGTGDRDVIEHVAKLSGLRIRDYWWPSVDAFCGRLQIKGLLRIGAEIVDEQWALARSTEKKVTLAKAVAKLFDSENASLNAEQRSRAAEWLPEMMVIGSDVVENSAGEPGDEPELPETSCEVPAFLEEIAEGDDMEIAAQ